MKSVKDIQKTLESLGVSVTRTTIIMDIRLKRLDLTAVKVANSYVIDDDVAKRYIQTRIALASNLESSKSSDIDEHKDEFIRV